MSGLTLRLVPALAQISTRDWDALACPDPKNRNPFVRWAFLQALEETGCTGPGTGWQAMHLIAEDAGGALKGAVPLYGKSHSQGEYVFDHGWAHAYEQAGGRYYPKLQACVPFTPVPGPRLLAASDSARAMLAAGLRAAPEQTGASSVHATFARAADMAALKAQGFLERLDVQYHFHNPGYAHYEDFLASLSSRKRKALRKERRKAQEGLVIEHLSGASLHPEHWDAFFAFYQDTGARKWGRPYLNRAFFEEIHARMADDVLLIMAREDGNWIAGALNFIGGDTLYGRYWGRLAERPLLHFELCYHQAIDAAIARKLARVEAGAQGGHKIARGYAPVLTRSAHWFRDTRLHEAVADFLRQERAAIHHDVSALEAMTPFRKGGGLAPSPKGSGDDHGTL